MATDDVGPAGRGRNPVRFFTALQLVCLVAVAQAAQAAEDVSGKAVFEQWCAGCHADTPFAPGTIALRASRGAAYAVLETRADLAPAYVRAIVRKGLAGMPSFRRVEIDETALTALVEYLAAAGESEQ